jgi:uncharacterized membrane protein
MAIGMIAAQWGGPSRRDHSSPHGRGGGAMRDLGWLPVALGAAAIVAGLGGRQKSTVALALTALASVTAVGALRGAQPEGIKAGGKGQGGGFGAVRQVARSITIGRSADELRRAWLDPETLPQIMAGFATVRATGSGRMHWKVAGPLGRSYEWDSETVPDQPGDGMGWRSSPDAAIWNEGLVRFSPAPGDRGTVATLRFRFDPPGGVLGDAAVELLARTPLDLAADGVLRRFKSLVETGEIPTTERQPAARADTR